MADGKDWYFNHNDEQVGPMTAGEMKEAAKRGKLLPTDLVWREGMEDWVEATKIRGLLPKLDADDAPSEVAPKRATPAKPRVEAAPEAKKKSAFKKEEDEDDDVIEDFEEADEEDEDSPRPKKKKKKKRHGAYVGLWRRFCAAMADGMLMWIVVIGLSVMLGVVFDAKKDRDEASVVGMILLVVIIGMNVMMIYMEGQGATPGKLAMGIKVVGEDGNPIGFGKAFLRQFGKGLSALFLYIGFLLALFNPEKQTAYDFALGTFVVENK
jgi:uncharacterized RDD family membrane protein YckC